jgi:GNAT superfamily N-acetyltransferase
MKIEDTIRAEGAERAALADLHIAASPDLRESLGLDLEEVGGAVVSIARRHPTILVNRTVGLGLAQPTNREDVDAIVDRYRGAGVGRYFLQLDPAATPEELPEWLGDAGLEPYNRAWAKFKRGAEPVPAPRSDLEVREIGAGHAREFGRIAAAGFELDDAWIPVLAGLVGRDGWHVYMSFDGDQPAGCGAMRIHGGVGWLDWAATLPEFRRRGSQGAVITRRISDGRTLGCDSFATSTGEAVKGDAQHSYRNIERYGFRRTHARANWVPKG